MNVVKGTTKTYLKYFDLAGIGTFLFAILLVFSYAANQQSIFAEQLNKQLTQQHDINHVITPLLPVDVYQISYQQQSLTVKDKPLLKRELKPNQEFGLAFYHPVYAIVSTPVLVFSFIYLLGFAFLRARLQNELSKKLADINSLESWADLAKSHTKPPSLSVNNKIADYIVAMQLELDQAKKGQSRFDQEIRENALLDPKTRIGNRDFFTSHLEAMLREEESRGAVFLIQLKGCELVHNLYGENQAFTLLETVIESIKSRIRHIPDCFLSRRNEYELAILTPGLYVNETEKLAERMLKNLTSLPLPIGVNKDEFCHFGISYFKNDRKLYQIMSEADMALRSAQLQGPSQWFMYDPGEVAKESAIGSLKWRTFLHQVIDKKLFIIFSQPVIDTKNHAILHYEVLSKIKNNRGGLISPRIFLPMAEKCGLSSQLDLMVFEQVCQLMTYEAQSHSYSVNFSIEALLSEVFRAKLYQLLETYPDVNDKVIIEISEYHLKSRFNEFLPVIKELRQHGFRILADKVGQYIVNAQYLKQCQISYVKLHRSIVLDINTKPENQIFVQSMKVLCEPLGINLFAVGVENVDEWRTLIKLGVCGGQGHYFDEPVAQMANAID